MRRFVFIAANEGIDWGGSEYCWALAAEKLARGGAQVRVSVKNWGRQLEQVERLRDAGCEIFYRTEPSLVKRAGRKLFLRNGYLEHHVSQIGKDADLIVISQGGNTDGLLWIEAARASGRKYGIISQAAAEQWWRSDDLIDRLRAAFDGAAAAYFVSEANLTLSKNQFLTPLVRGRVIQNPFNVRFDANPEWPGNPEEKLLLACVARLEIAQKGLELLIEVLDRPHWRSRNIHVTLVGSGLNERALRRMVEDRKLSSITFAGFVDDMEKLWSRHHALVLPSRYEGMPLALVEAMLCGRACIVTDVGGNRELVRDNDNGFLVRAANVELLDEGMDAAWENRHRLKEMGEAAARDVRKWVSPNPTEDFVRELEALVDGAS